MAARNGDGSGTGQLSSDSGRSDDNPAELEAGPEREPAANRRARANARRLATAARRDEVARVRDRTAAVHDTTAQARDEAAAVRDRAAEERELHAAEAGDLDEAIDTLRALLTSGASVRHQAALERVAAAADRQQAAADRAQAAADRRDVGLDELTGVFRRSTGELALTHEIDRSHRSGQSLVLARIDVDGLQAVNDIEGHAAGDALLRDVPAAITATLRSYDVIVRWGGDQFACALSDVTLEAAAQRLAWIQSGLEGCGSGASLSVGLAELADGDTLESLIARADGELRRARGARWTPS